MKWALHSEQKHIGLARDQMESTIPDAYLTVTTDERIAHTALSNNLIDYFAQEKIVPVPEVEKIVLLVGPNVVSILGTPRSPVKTVVTTLLGAQAKSTANTSNSNPSSRVTLSISAYKGEHLVDGVPLVRKLAIGLGIIDEAATNNDVSSISRHLKFGATSGYTDALEVNSAVEADSLCKAMISSVSFQRVIQYVSLHVRVGLSFWSDHSVDGDDAPHWINKSVVSLWFVSSRHLQEYLERARRSISQDSPFRFVAGYGRVGNEESAASVADTAALTWHVMVKSGKITPMSMVGRRDINSDMDGDGDGSPRTKALKESAKFAVEKRAALVARATDLMHAREFQPTVSNEETLSEIKRLQEFLVALGHSHDQAETQFQEAVTKLEAERATFRAIEDELAAASQVTTKLQSTVTEQEVLRKALLQDIATLTARKEAVTKSIEAEEAQLKKELHDRDSLKSEQERKLDLEQREMDREFDFLKKQFAEEQEMAQREVNAEVDGLQRDLQVIRENAGLAGSAANEALESKRADLVSAKNKLSRLDAEAKEANLLSQQQKSEMSVLAAEYDRAMQSYSTTQGLTQALKKYREECASAESERRSLDTKLEHIRGMVRQVRSNREAQETSLFQGVAMLEDKHQTLKQEWYQQCSDECTLREELERMDRLCVEEAEKIARVGKKWAAQHLVSQQRMREHLAEIVKRRNDLQDKLLDVQNATHNVEMKSDGLDQQMEATRADIAMAEKQKEEIEAELRKSLDEIRAEKYRMQDHVAGSQDNRFPLLEAQRKDFEDRLSLLRSCMITSSTHTAEKGVSLLVNRRALVETAETLLNRISNLERRSQSELDSRLRSLVSLRSKGKHLEEETSLREDLLQKLDSSESDQKRRIQTLRTETNSLQSALAESVNEHLLTMNDLLEVANTVESSGNKDMWDVMQRKRSILHSLTLTKQTAASLDGEVARVQSEIHQLQRKRKEVDELQ